MAPRRSKQTPSENSDGIVRRPLSEQLASALRQMIVAGEVEPGERLQEAELSARFGVSRTPLREALKVLATEGLVTLAPNKGATVTSLTPEEVAETFPVMGALEALAGELAARAATDADISELQALHAELRQHFAARDLARYFATNQTFHARILATARNTVLAEMTQQLAGRVAGARYRVTMTDAQWARAMDEHEAMMVALVARDAATLGRIMRQHVDTKLETVRCSLE